MTPRWHWRKSGASPKTPAARKGGVPENTSSTPRLSITAAASTSSRAPPRQRPADPQRQQMISQAGPHQQSDKTPIPVAVKKIAGGQHAPFPDQGAPAQQPSQGKDYQKKQGKINCGKKHKKTAAFPMPGCPAGLQASTYGLDEMYHFVPARSTETARTLRLSASRQRASARWHRHQRPGANSFNGGNCARQISMAYGQRG